MYQMKTAYRLENQAQPGNPSTFGLYSGISLKVELSADPISGVPSNFSIYLSNGNNTLSFNWGPEALALSIMTKDYSVPAYPTPTGTSKTIAITAPYKTVSVYMNLQGPNAYVRATYNSINYELYGDLYAGLPNYVSSWNVFMESYSVGVPCGTVVNNYSVSADDTDSSTTHINYITLTTRDISRKYAILSGNAPANLQLNLAQAASLRYGTDYVVVGNRLMWEGLGLDIPALKPGMTLRPIFAGSSYGEPNILRIGKRIISLQQGELSPVPPVPKEMDFTATVEFNAVTELWLSQSGAAAEVYIDWGDGTTETIQLEALVDPYAPQPGAYAKHTFQPGTYTLKARNFTFNRWSFADLVTYVTHILSWGGDGNTYGNMTSAFEDCTTLVAISAKWTRFATADWMFGYCESLVSIPDSWAGLYVEDLDLDSMFRNCYVLANIPATWDGLEFPTNVGNMFLGTAISSIPSSWIGLCDDNISDNVISWSMFSSCPNLSTIPTSWEGFNNLGIALEMFYECTALTTIPSSWTGMEYTSGLDITGLFMYCTGITSIPSSWEGLNGHSDLSSLFSGCTALTTIPTTWSGLNSLENMYDMFASTAISAIPSTWTGLETVTSLYYTFSYCESLTSIPASWAPLTNLANARRAFEYCSLLTNVGTADYSALANITNVNGMFRGNTGINTSILELYQFLNTLPILDTLIPFLYPNTYRNQDCFAGCTNAPGYSTIASTDPVWV